MPEDEDSVIPDEEEGVDRRRFVKGAVGAASLGVAGAAGFGMFRQIAVPGDTIVRFVDYLGARAMPGSPAPRGLPFIPVRVNDEGFVEGVPEKDGVNYLDRLRYCGYQNAPNLKDPSSGDNVFRYFLTEEKIHQADDPEGTWFFLDKIGDRVRAEDFADQDYNTGAAVRWRSEDVPGSDIVTMMILKLDPDRFEGPNATELEQFMDMDHHLVGLSAICTHFCCVPGYKEAKQKADSFGAWEMAFCTCHNSRFNPYEITGYNFMLREKVEEDD